MASKSALVLSGGGMFGAWQAGAWRALAPRFKPDLVVGASVGSLNGYAIAAGWSATDLCHWWLRPGVASFQNLPKIVHGLMDVRPLELEYAVVLVDLLRMKPRTVTGPTIRPHHLLASCAVPFASLPRSIDRRWYIDGGLLNPLPVWAAVELGATRIVALNALPEFPSALLRPFAKAFRAVFGHHPPLQPGVEITTLMPRRPLGSLHDALHWKQENIAQWIKQGAEDAAEVLRYQKTGGPYHHTMKYILILLAAPLWAQTIDQLEAHRVTLAAVEYQGKRAVRLDAPPNVPNGESYAVLKGKPLHNGTIEAFLAGKPGANAAPDARGFIGIAFRLQGNRYEYIHLRPTNGRADDQVRRNHSVQYGAHPGYDFYRLRRESPEKYESYIDLQPGVWTRYKIVIDGTKARLYVNGAEQPCLIVNDMKLGDSEGGMAL